MTRKKGGTVMTQEVRGDFQVTFFALPIPILGMLFFVSKTTLVAESENSVTCYTFHFTPFFTLFGLVLPKKNPR